MNVMRTVFVVAAFAAGNAAVQVTFAQDSFPNRVIRIVTPATGGGSDLLARMISSALTELLGQQVIVDNIGATPHLAGE